ncbi:ankyrin repeat domain-containing protein [Flavobacterium sp. U410]|jgi:ankyrin repeat protein
MKKTISYLGLAFVLCTTAVEASNVNLLHSKTYEMYYDANPLCAAISKGDLKAVSIMIDYGADINETSSRGMTPLMYAAIYNNTEIIKLLVEKGARLGIKDNRGFTALDHAKASESMEAIELLSNAMAKK